MSFWFNETQILVLNGALKDFSALRLYFPHSLYAVLQATGGGGGTLGIFGWGCAAGTLEPLTYTRTSSAEFCYPLLE